METRVLLKNLDNGIWYVTFQYWKKGACACTAKKQKSMFSNDPTPNDLINAIEHGL